MQQYGHTVRIHDAQLSNTICSDLWFVLPHSLWVIFPLVFPSPPGLELLMAVSRGGRQRTHALSSFSKCSAFHEWSVLAPNF